MIDLINKIVSHICYRCGEDECMRGIEHDCDGCILSEVVDEIKSINDKPHGRLIDADKLCEVLNEKKIPVDSRVNYEIVNAPTVTAATDGPHGEWIKEYNGDGWNDYWDYKCSKCGKVYKRASAILYDANYCPNCGKRMKAR
jgi:DNA-directed RNA polymerase subunit RPC12/RpoP